MDPLTILSWGGIGDTLRNISLVPHRVIYEKLGVRCAVVHKHWRTVGCLEHAEAPEPPVFKDLVGRCPSLVWRGEITNHRGMGQWVNRGLRETLKALRLGSPSYYRFSLRLTADERRAISTDEGFMLGIQTHLGGMKTKRWGLENWRLYLEALLSAERHLSIILFDTAPEVEALCFDPRIKHTRAMNIAQSIEQCAYLDLLVSIDSWSKYVAAWNRIHQVIVVPDQRAEYPSLNARRLAGAEFAGILNHPSNLVIGLTGRKHGPELTLKHLSELSPDFLAQETLRWMRKVGKPRPKSSLSFEPNGTDP